MLATTPSGSWPMRSRMPAVVEHRLGASAASASARKKSMRPSRPFSSLRDCVIGLPISRVRVARERLDLGARRAARKRCDGGDALGERRRRPRRLRRARARCALRGDARRRRRPAASAISLAGGRVVRSCSVRHVGRCALRASRLEEVVQQRPCRRACLSPRAVELRVPLHADHVRARPGAADRLDHAVGRPSAPRRPGPAPRSLTPWWWTLLTRRRVDARRTAARAACRGSNVDLVEVAGRRSPRRGARSAPGRCVVDVLVSVPPSATLITCRPRQTPSTGLPRATKARTSSIS